MNRQLSRFLLLAVAGIALPVFADVATVDDPPVLWQTPTVESIEGDLRSWLGDSVGFAEEELTRLHADGDRLGAVVDCLAVGSPALAELVAGCRRSPPKLGPMEWLDSEGTPRFVRANVRLFAGRALLRSGYYEQAHHLLKAADLQDVADPASLLFYRAIAEHQLVKIEEAKATLTALLAADEAMPPRFTQLARLMQSDIARVEDDSLDHIARRMSDVRRRLGLGQSGERAQEIERGILASLDKAIKKAEEQQKQQQQQQSGGQPSGTPMEESRIVEQKGEGKVDIKEIGKQAGWGDLPPRERQRVMQQIGRDFPSHYSDLIEEYLRRLATDEREEPDE